MWQFKIFKNYSYTYIKPHFQILEISCTTEGDPCEDTIFCFSKDNHSPLFYKYEYLVIYLNEMNKLSLFENGLFMKFWKEKSSVRKALNTKYAVRLLRLRSDKHNSYIYKCLEITAVISVISPLSAYFWQLNIIFKTNILSHTQIKNGKYTRHIYYKISVE